MIKGLQGIGRVTVQGGNVSLPYIPPNINNPIQGMIRINNTDFEVFNGTSWMSLPSSYATVSLDQDTQDLLQWAREQRNKQKELEEWAKTHPTLQASLEDLKLAQLKLDLVTILCREEEQLHQ
jgi:hypothetical protein